MPRSSRSGLHALLIVAALFVGPVGCFEMDLTGLDLGSGSGCYLCYPDQGPIGQPPFDSIPVAVTGGLTFSAISVGTRHVCALGAGGSGGTYCWGARDAGTSAYRDVTSPLAIAGGEGFRRISAGESLTCGVSGTGVTSCWGINDYGQLGTGTAGAASPLPLPVQGALAFATVSTGASSLGLPHSCALTSTGAAYCWGGNDYGQLGNGSVTMPSAAPVAVSGGHSFESISVGGKFTCAIVRGDGVWCWGQATDGQLGDDPRDAGNCASGGGQLACGTVPVRIAGSNRFTSISAGGSHACALDADGVAYCWGSNLGGQLGIGDNSWKFAPTKVVTQLRFAMIAAGADATCALAVSGAAYCWGSNSLGQAGDGTTFARRLPTKVVTDLSFATLSAGYHTACALTADGAAYCWGSNESGKLGKGS